MQENNTGSTVTVLTPADMRAHCEPQRLREKQKTEVNIQKKSDVIITRLQTQLKAGNREVSAEVAYGENRDEILRRVVHAFAVVGWCVTTVDNDIFVSYPSFEE
jgi:hypothetical protein